MQYIAESTEFKLKNSVVTLGKFDGFHIGHQMLIDHIMELKECGYQAVMFTFHMHPNNLLHEEEFKLIYTEEEKHEQLKKLGIDVLIAYPFTKETASMTAPQFVEEVLVKKLDVQAIVVGSDFRFGKDRQGDVALLKSLSERFGYEVYCYDKVTYHGEVVSSTRIRNEIVNSNMIEVKEMLGRPFSITGTVMHGRKLGRTLGLPTINIIPSEDKLLPKNGVYLSWTLIDGVIYQGVTNIGYKPSVSNEQILGVETYLFDFDQNVYGKEVEVMLLSFIRPEMRFGCVEELKAQMLVDIKEAKERHRTME